ncbi:sensor histidine kinase [Parapedobacter koreensis]|uniref:Histidine kinase n=1 Tax=Parapedobacter koreensis TaxID=332977 RepID=A0A1H7QUQ8_9SPHI|nr:histidine kinase [Parapedobacter koreensis]SEL51365.1 Histidine kinase [Parapedobacter koreensis]
MKTATDFTKSRYYWLGLNLASILLGILISFIISTCVALVRGSWPSSRSMLISLMFGIIISLCIANSIHIIGLFSKRKATYGWGFLLVYYGVSLAGMVVGVELTYLLAAWLFDIPFRFFHLADLQFNAIICLIICTIIYIYFSMKERQKAVLQQKEMDIMRMGKLKTEAELAALQSKINPHFLYNALNSIASLIPSNPAKAEEMTVKLSNLFRQSINQEQGHWGTVASELDIVNTYIDIERVRFGERIRFSVAVEEGLEAVRMPRFLIQPLVENALKHGLKDVTENGLLDVQLKRQGGRLLIVVSDNGQPFPDELKAGYGLQSTYDKLQLLYGEDYQVSLLNSPHKQLTISIPLEA